MAPKPKGKINTAPAAGAPAAGTKKAAAAAAVVTENPRRAVPWPNDSEKERAPAAASAVAASSSGSTNKAANNNGAKSKSTANRKAAAAAAAAADPNAGTKRKSSTATEQKTKRVKLEAAFSATKKPAAAAAATAAMSDDDGGTDAAADTSVKPRSKGKKKAKKAKDPNAPKKPPSSFFIFCDEKRREAGDIKFTQKELSEAYKAISEDERQAYIERAKPALDEHAKALKQYNARKAQPAVADLDGDADMATADADADAADAADADADAADATAAVSPPTKARKPAKSQTESPASAGCKAGKTVADRKSSGAPAAKKTVIFDDNSQPAAAAATASAKDVAAEITKIKKTLRGEEFKQVLVDVKKFLGPRAKVYGRIDKERDALLSQIDNLEKPDMRIGLFGPPGAGKSLFINRVLGFDIVKSADTLGRGVTLFPILVRGVPVDEPFALKRLYISDTEYAERITQINAVAQRTGTNHAAPLADVKFDEKVAEMLRKNAGTEEIDARWATAGPMHEFTREQIAGKIRSLTSALDGPERYALKMFIVEVPHAELSENKVQLLDMSGYPDEHEKELRRQYISSVIRTVHILCPFLTGRGEMKAALIADMLACKAFDHKKKPPKLVFVLSVPPKVDMKNPAKSAADAAKKIGNQISKRGRILTGRMKDSDTCDHLRDILCFAFDVSLGVRDRIDEKWKKDIGQPVEIDAATRKVKALLEHARLIVLTTAPFKGDPARDIPKYDFRDELKVFVEERRAEERLELLCRVCRTAFSLCSEISLAVRQKAIAHMPYSQLMEDLRENRAKLMPELSQIRNMNTAKEHLQTVCDSVLEAAAEQGSRSAAMWLRDIWSALKRNLRKLIHQQLQQIVVVSLATIKEGRSRDFTESKKRKKELTEKELEKKAKEVEQLMDYLDKTTEDSQSLFSHYIEKIMEPFNRGDDILRNSAQFLDNLQLKHADDAKPDADSDTPHPFRWFFSLSAVDPAHTAAFGAALREDLLEVAKRLHDHFNADQQGFDPWRRSDVDEHEKTEVKLYVGQYAKDLAGFIGHFKTFTTEWVNKVQPSKEELTWRSEYLEPFLNENKQCNVLPDPAKPVTNMSAAAVNYYARGPNVAQQISPRHPFKLSLIELREYDPFSSVVTGMKPAGAAAGTGAGAAPAQAAAAAGGAAAAAAADAASARWRALGSGRPKRVDVFVDWKQRDVEVQWDRKVLDAQLSELFKNVKSSGLYPIFFTTAFRSNKSAPQFHLNSLHPATNDNPVQMLRSLVFIVYEAHDEKNVKSVDKIEWGRHVVFVSVHQGPRVPAAAAASSSSANGNKPPQTKLGIGRMRTVIQLLVARLGISRYFLVDDDLQANEYLPYEAKFSPHAAAFPRALRYLQQIMEKEKSPPARIAAIEADLSKQAGRLSVMLGRDMKSEDEAPELADLLQSTHAAANAADPTLLFQLMQPYPAVKEAIEKIFKNDRESTVAQVAVWNHHARGQRPFHSRLNAVKPITHSVTHVRYQLVLHDAISERKLHIVDDDHFFLPPWTADDVFDKAGMLLDFEKTKKRKHITAPAKEKIKELRDEMARHGYKCSDSYYNKRLIYASKSGFQVYCFSVTGTTERTVVNGNISARGSDSEMEALATPEQRRAAEQEAMSETA